MKHKSKKGFTLVEIMIVVVIIGLLAAMAIPAFQKVRTTSQEKAITNNLRQFASAAQQYMLDHGVATVDYTSIVGDTKHISTITPVRGESYTGLSITTTTTELSISDVTFRF
jgi:type IV pilus assembly protein PilA